MQKMQQKLRLKWIDKNYGEDLLKLTLLRKIQIEFKELLKQKKKLLMLKKTMKM
jgi:hypothetical protein